MCDIGENISIYLAMLIDHVGTCFTFISAMRECSGTKSTVMIKDIILGRC